MVTLVVLTSRGPRDGFTRDLANQTYKDFEVIFAAEKGIVNAMNAALRRANGDIFVRIDDDVSLPPEWLEELVAPFKNWNVAGVTGPTFVPKDRRQYRDSIRWAENPHWFLRWLYDNGKFAPGMIRKCGCVSYDSNFEERFCLTYSGKNELRLFRPDYLEGTNWAMRTELIRGVGGFDPKFDGVAEWFDTDVVYKIKKLGYELRYNPRAYLYHLLEKGDHFEERFEGWGRIKNFLRFHIRHGKFHYKMVIYLIIWMGYFVWKRFKK